MLTLSGNTIMLIFVWIAVLAVVITIYEKRFKDAKPAEKWGVSILVAFVLTIVFYFAKKRFTKGKF